MVSGPSIVFTQKAVVDKTFLRNLTNLCKLIVDFDPRQMHPYSRCQPLPTALCTRWALDTETNRLLPQQNKSRSLENLVKSYFQRVKLDCKFESFYATGRLEKKIIVQCR